MQKIIFTIERIRKIPKVPSSAGRAVAAANRGNLNRDCRALRSVLEAGEDGGGLRLGRLALLKVGIVS